MSAPGGNGDDISDEARLMAAEVRERASHLPTAAELAGLGIDASSRGDMTPAEIRHLATQAVEQATQVSYLLGKLAALLDQPGESHG